MASIIVRLMLAMIVAAVAACGSSGTAPQCQGSTCTCPSGQTCSINTGTCGASCTLNCTNNTDCVGECGSSCSLKCAGTSTCNMTVDQSGSVVCSGGSTCHIVCKGQCSVSCNGGSTCTLQCATDTQPKSIPNGGGCQ